MTHLRNPLLILLFSIMALFALATDLGDRPPHIMSPVGNPEAWIRNEPKVCVMTTLEAKHSHIHRRRFTFIITKVDPLFVTSFCYDFHRKLFCQQYDCIQGYIDVCNRDCRNGYKDFVCDRPKWAHPGVPIVAIKFAGPRKHRVELAYEFAMRITEQIECQRKTLSSILLNLSSLISSSEEHRLTVCIVVVERHVRPQVLLDETTELFMKTFPYTAVTELWDDIVDEPVYGSHHSTFQQYPFDPYPNGTIHA